MNEILIKPLRLTLQEVRKKIKEKYTELQEVCHSGIVLVGRTILRG